MSTVELCCANVSTSNRMGRDDDDEERDDAYNTSIKRECDVAKTKSDDSIIPIGSKDKKGAKHKTT